MQMKKLSIVLFSFILTGICCGCVTTQKDDIFATRVYDMRYERQLDDIMQQEVESELSDIVEVVNNMSDSVNFKRIVMGDSDIALDVHIEKESFDLSFRISNK